MTPTVADFLRAVEAGDDGLAAHYGAQLDEPCTVAAEWVQRPDALLLSAIDYARRLRLRVLPVVPNGKKPLGGRCCGGTHERGCTDASTDPAVVARWWREHPAANVGIATGHRVDVIDQDGPEGAISWARMGRAGAWPAVLGVVLTVRSEGAGVHRYVASTGDGNGTKIGPGIDYRGRGGYVVAPPSIIDGKRYAWALPLDLEGIR